MAGESRTPEYLKMNPSGFVPVLQEDDFVLTEGGAILSYIAKTRKLTDWLPADPKAQSKVNFWMHWNHTYMRQTPELKGVKEALAFMEARLGESGPFLAGTDKPTIAYLFVVPEVDQLVLFGVMELGEYPKVSAWLKAMEAALPKYGENVQQVKEIVASLAAK